MCDPPGSIPGSILTSIPTAIPSPHSHSLSQLLGGMGQGQVLGGSAEAVWTCWKSPRRRECSPLSACSVMLRHRDSSLLLMSGSVTGTWNSAGRKGEETLVRGPGRDLAEYTWGKKPLERYPKKGCPHGWIGCASLPSASTSGKRHLHKQASLPCFLSVRGKCGETQRHWSRMWMETTSEGTGRWQPQALPMLRPHRVFCMSQTFTVGSGGAFAISVCQGQHSDMGWQHRPAELLPGFSLLSHPQPHCHIPRGDVHKQR